MHQRLTSALVIFSVFYCPFLHGQNIIAKYLAPSKCGAADATITLNKLPNVVASYQVSYLINGTAITPRVIMSSATGVLIIDSLSNGVYTSISVNDGAKTLTVSGSYTISDACIATQTVKFVGAGFANFVGVQDDDPSGFAQIYARLSQPLNKYQGIRNDASIGKRWIWFRNFVFQITYGNTNNFGLYTKDTLGDKYVNRLDLLGHNYFNGSLGLNIVTFVVPKNWHDKTGDMAHVYLDLITSYLMTTVTDTLQGSSSATNKNYNVKSNVFGFNFKSSFSSVFDTRFSIESALQLIWIFPSSSSVNPYMNPQSSNVPDIYSQQNLSRDFRSTAKNVHPYLSYEALVQYNTGTNQASNSSNVFLRYAYTSNYARNSSKNYPNNYFQFQIGYALDISKIFTPPAAASGSANN